MKLFRKSASRPPFRLFFATDVHGSDRCFRKFLAAASAYKADALVLGGDVAGKAMVPIVPESGKRFSFTFQGVHRTVEADELDEVTRRLNFNGFYGRITEPAEIQQMTEDPGYVARLFEEVIAGQLSDWCVLAQERLADDVRCLITPGNDDPFVIDAVLERAEKVECPERATIEVGPIWMASLGNTNRTPWATDREYDEPDLGRQIREMVDPFTDGRPLVFNFHCPLSTRDSTRQRSSTRTSGRCSSTVRRSRYRSAVQRSTRQSSTTSRWQAFMVISMSPRRQLESGSHGASTLGATIRPVC